MLPSESSENIRYFIHQVYPKAHFSFLNSSYLQLFKAINYQEESAPKFGPF